MNKLLFVILVTCGNVCFSQVYHPRISSISNEKNNVLFSGIENPLSIVVQNIPSDKIIAKSSYGQLTKWRDGYYSFYTDTGSTVKIFLYSKLKNDNAVTVYEFKVQPLPDPQPRIENKTGGKISLAEIHQSTTITVDSFGFEKKIPILSFQLSIIRNNNYLLRDLKNTGETFSPEILAALGNAEAGDSIIFRDILALRKDKTVTILNPLTFLLTN